MAGDKQILLDLADTIQIEIILEMMEKFYAIDQYPFYKDKSEENIKKLIGNPELGRLWLIYFNKQIAGYIALTFGFSFEYGGRDAFIDELYIEENFRGRGIGNAVIENVIEEAKKLSVQSIHLEVESHNSRGKALYIKHGFEGNKRSLLTRKLF